MVTLARNVIFNRLSARPAAVLSLDSDDIAAVVSAISIERDPAIGRDLERCLAELKEEQRHAVILAYHYGLSYHELAAQAGVPLGTIKTWIHRAIGQLQSCLNQ
jgi:RNA polymerase sigma-70 factor (ECF subfamily)